MGEKILLVDDDVELVEMLRDYLTQEGFEVTMVHDGESGVREALSGRYAIAVVDVMMPGINGIEVLRRVRGESAIPVLMLTARGDDTDRILGLELGADDYVPKPCTARELAARIRAILKRTGNTGEGESRAIKVGTLAVWPEKRKVEREGQTVDLTSTEFGLLEVLMRNAGQVVSKEELSEHALGRPLQRFDRSIDMHMCNIRQKLGEASDGRSRIQTVIRKGYMLIRE
ncbi:MAG: response regulator transcription factor [Gammaproteobacteria bacterium]|nr:response regulator transcription factor [Gammaproteobacteria bacterium]MBU1481922.1 response regulator transcription factor [Gammaproteobacteria bacterium]